MSRDEGFSFKAVSAVVGLFVVLLVSVGMWGCPKYKIYSLDKDGQADLAKAAWTRKIQIEEKKSALEAAEFSNKTLEANAAAAGRVRVIASRADSLANAIVAGSLVGESGQRFMQYLWINKTIEASTQLIYLPPFGQLPFTEAGRAVPK